MKSFDDYSKEYSSGLDRSYLTISIPAEEEIKQYQIKMLDKNKIDLLLPMTMQRINDDWKLFYDITSKIPLNRVLQRKAIEQQTFLHLMHQILKLTRELKDYLLDLSSVVFDISHIFCDPSGLDLYFMYIPTEIYDNEQDMLKTFLKKLLVEDITLSEDSSGVLLKRFLEVLKEDNFSVEQLSQCFDISDATKTPLTHKSEIIESNQTVAVSKDYSVPQFKTGITGSTPNSYNNREFERPKKYTEKPNQKERQPYKNKTNNIAISPKKEDNRKNIISLKPKYIIIGAANLLMLGFFTYLLASASFNSGSITGKITGMVLILGAANYFLITRLAERDKVAQNTNMKESRNKPAHKNFVNNDIEEDIILLQRPLNNGRQESNTVYSNMQGFQRPIINDREKKIENPLENRSKPSIEKPTTRNLEESIEKPIKRRLDESVEMPIMRHSENLGAPAAIVEMSEEIFPVQFKENPIERTFERKFEEHLDKSEKSSGVKPSVESSGRFSSESSGRLSSGFIEKPVFTSAHETSMRRPVSDKTVVLGKSHVPYLQNNANSGDRIKLNNNSILIGRLEDSVDHVIQNNAVGKIHAEIIEKEGEYFVIDLNSVNGTFINGERVLCNSPVLISSSDKVTFANETYTVF